MIGHISSENIQKAKRSAETSRQRVTDELEALVQLPPAIFTEQLGKLFHYPCLTQEELHLLYTPDFTRLSFSDSVKKQCLVLTSENQSIHLAISDPFDTSINSWAEDLIKVPPKFFVVHRTILLEYLASFEEAHSAIDEILSGNEISGNEIQKANELSLQSISEDSSPVVKLVNSTLYDSLKAGASDIHLECIATGLHIKNRIDGVLVTIGTIAGTDTAEQAISRIKILSELDISERRIPQDGRFRVSIQNRDVDFRVSIIPSIHGEDAVLRILDKQSLSDEMSGLSLTGLGYHGAQLAQMRRLISEPYGMFLVTGPTGSGKTTTLYAAISESNNGLDKIITIEDPVEYQLAGVMQIPVNEKKGLTFARGLRSILRHDPDKIMVGEIRDSETAEIAVQAALTGHLVFTTVHANNVFDVISRLIHMGLDPYSFVSAINGVMAQRLIRLNCPHCSVENNPSQALIDSTGINIEDSRHFVFKQGQGCSSCRGTGYKGRTAIAEIMVLDDEIRELIVTRAPTRKLKELAHTKGTRFLREAAVDLARTGITSLEEINRVTFVA